MNEFEVTASFHSDIPLSPKVMEAAEKLNAGIVAAVSAMDAPDGEELFDIVLTAAAAFFAIAPLNKSMRRAIVDRFDKALCHQAGRVTLNGEPT